MTFLPMSYLLLMARQPSRKKPKTCLSPSIIQNTHMTSCDWAQWATTLDTWIMCRMIWIRWKICFVMMHISWILISCWGWVNRKCVENKLQKLQTYTMTSGRESFQCFIYGFSFLLYVDFKQSKYALNLHVTNHLFDKTKYFEITSDPEWCSAERRATELCAARRLWCWHSK